MAHVYGSALGCDATPAVLVNVCSRLHRLLIVCPAGGRLPAGARHLHVAHGLAANPAQKALRWGFGPSGEESSACGPGSNGIAENHCRERSVEQPLQWSKTEDALQGFRTVATRWKDVARLARALNTIGGAEPALSAGLGRGAGWVGRGTRTLHTKWRGGADPVTVCSFACDRAGGCAPACDSTLHIKLRLQEG